MLSSTVVFGISLAVEIYRLRMTLARDLKKDFRVLSCYLYLFTLSCTDNMATWCYAHSTQVKQSVKKFV